MEKEQVKNTALAVSLAILDGRWKDLDNLLDENFTYTGDGFVFTKDEYIGFMQDMKAAFSGLKMEFPHIVVDGDTVSIRFISTAVNTGKFYGCAGQQKEPGSKWHFHKKSEGWQSNARNGKAPTCWA
jgi:predicted ester cyclase